jgi:GNAT superfamily N-acetyltransferase
VTIAPVEWGQPAFGAVAAMFDDYRAGYGHPPSPAATRAWLQEQVARRRLAVAAALRGGGACGFVTTAVMPASLTLGTAWLIRDLYVVPARRRGGVASALLDFVVGDARAAGARRVSLQTETGNAAALALYAAAGFRPVAGLELLNLPL